MSEAASHATGGGGSQAKSAHQGAVKGGADVSSLIRRGQGSLEDAVFGVLYTLRKDEGDHSWKASVAHVVLVLAQLLLVMFSKDHPWNFKHADYLLEVLPAEPGALLRHVGYDGFLVCIFVGAGIMALAYATCAYVAQTFRSGRTFFQAPIKLGRLLLSFFARTFFVYTLTTFLVAMSCDFFSQDGVPPHNVVFEDQRCDAMPHAAVAALAIPAAAMTIYASYYLTVAETDPHPLSGRVLASPFSKVQTRVFWCVTLVTTCSVFLRNYPIHFGAVSAALFAYCLAATVHGVPHVKAWVNMAHAGIWGALAWAGGLLCATGVTKSADSRELLTAVAFYGMVPASLLGVLAVWLRLNRIGRVARVFYVPPETVNAAVRTATRARHSQAGAPPGRAVGIADIESTMPIHHFRDESEVEAAARCLRWTDEFGNVDEGWATAAEIILRMGLTQFPDSPALSMLYYSFLTETKAAGQQSQQLLSRVKKLRTGADLRFQIFCRDREQTQGGGTPGMGGGGEGAMDLISYVEFQNKFKGAKKSHRKALWTIREFWRMLLTRTSGFHGLSETLGTLVAVESKANKVYRYMLEQYPQNSKLLRSVARFLEEVQMDPWKGLRMFEEAVKIEDMQAEARKDALLQDMGDGDGGQMGHATAGDNDGVVVISDMGIIQMANRNIYDMFGYKMGELEGMNVSCMMPPPFSTGHNGYLRAYKTTGKAKVLNTRRVLTAMHKDRSVFPIWLLVTKVQAPDGSEQFMGLITPVAVDLKKGIIYMTMSGSMLCVNAGFTDNFGYKSTHVLGQMVSSLAPAESRWEEELASVQEKVEKLTEKILADQQAQVDARRRLSAQGAKTGRRGSVDGGRSPDPGADQSKGEKGEDTFVANDNEDKLKDLRFNMTESIRHKYSRAVIKVDVEIALGGTDTTRLLELTLTPTEPPDGVIVFDTAGKLVYVNKEVENLLGYRAGAMMRRELTLDKCLPSPYNQFHTKQLKDLFARGEQPSPDIPCFNNHLVHMVGKGKKSHAVRMRWWPSRDPQGVLLVAAVLPPPVDPFMGLWEPESGDALLHNQICLRVVTTPNGRIVGVGGGNGFHKKGIPGEVFGIHAADMIGESLSAYIDMMDTAVKNAQRYNAGVTTEQVMEEFIENLSRKMRSLALASYRASFLGEEAEPGGEDDPVPVRLRVVQLGHSKVKLGPLVEASLASGCWDKDFSEPSMRDLLQQDGFLFELWSANWLTASLRLSKDHVLRHVSRELEIMTGCSARSLLGKSLAEVVGESGIAGITQLVKGAARVQIEAKHADGSQFQVSATGAQKNLGQEEIFLLFRGVYEESGTPMEALRRTEGLLATDCGDDDKGRTASGSGDRAAEKAVTKPKGRVSFSANVGEETKKELLKTPNKSSRGMEVEEDSSSEEEPDDGLEGAEEDEEAKSETGFSDAASSAAGSDASQLAEGQRQSHFKRAKRFRKLRRALKLSSAVASSEILTVRTTLAVLATYAIHILMFALLADSVIRNQHFVESALDAGVALHNASEMAAEVRMMQDIAAGGPWLRDSQWGQSLDDHRELLRMNAEEMETSVEFQYIGNLMKGHNHRERGALFEEPEIEITLFDDAGGMAVEFRKDSVSLMELSEQTSQKSYLISDFPETTLSTAQDSDRHWNFIFANTQDTLIPNLYKVLHYSGDEALGKLKGMQTDTVIMAVVQSILVIPLVAFVLWYHLMSLDRARQSIYNIFLSVPRPILWSLAAAEISVDDDEDERAGPGDLTWARNVTLTKEEARMADVLSKGNQAKQAKVARSIGGVQVSAEKLPVENYKAMWWYCGPLLALSVVTLCLNMAAYALVTKVTPPVQSNIVVSEIFSGVVNMRFFANELVVSPNPDDPSNDIRAVLREKTEEVQSNWDDLVFGDSKKGLQALSRASYEIRHVLFEPQCMREDQSTCLSEDHPNYTSVSNGLDRAVRALINETKVLSYEPAYDPNDKENSLGLHNRHFEHIWEASPNDIEGGLHEIDKVLRHEAQNVLYGVIALQSTTFAIITVVYVVYAFITRPFSTHVTQELAAIAKMLGQVPDGIQIDAVVNEVLEIRDETEMLDEEQLSIMGQVGRTVGNAVARMLLGRRFKLFLQYEKVTNEQRRKARIAAAKERQAKAAM